MIRAIMVNPIRPLLASTALATLAIVAAPAQAQPALGQSAVDAEIDPFPFDPRLELRELFRKQMPTYWWFEEPEFSAGTFTMVVHLPAMWRGNPTGAVMQLCPDHGHPIWKGLERFFIRPFHQKRPWPTFECRP